MLIEVFRDLFQVRIDVPRWRLANDGWTREHDQIGFKSRHTSQLTQNKHTGAVPL